jgi:hypothetical protein
MVALLIPVSLNWRGLVASMVFTSTVSRGVTTLILEEPPLTL